SSRRRHTRSKRDWSSDVCSSDLRLYGRILIFVRRRITVSVKQKSIERKENILLSLKKLDYLTIKQLQKLHDLKSGRNAYRVMKRSEERRVGKEGRCRVARSDQ